MSMAEIGELIKERRKSLGVEQSDVAELANTSTHTLSNIETGKANPTFAVLNRVLDVLGLEIVVQTKRLPDD